MDEGKLLRQTQRAEHAKRILEDELVKEAFEQIHQACVEAWENSAADDERGRYNAYLMQRLLKNFQQQFTNIVRTGDKANKDLLQLREPSRFRRMING